VSALLAAAPALPLHTAGKYVAGAYVVFMAIVLLYVIIMAVRLSRTEREVAELVRDLEAKAASEVVPPPARSDPGRGPSRDLEGVS
jgi:TRAP-type C4-dicarboxylate transport system permease small subunit